ncbi:MAG TPA: hypothetical protein VGF24_03580 [Vicinamibacterales bacterium]
MTSPSSVNVTGTWSGTVGAGSGGGRALRLTWAATQSGSSVSGPITVLTSPPVTDLTVTGTLHGSLDGSHMSLTLAVSAGSVPGSPECSLSGSGSTTVSTTTMSGTLDVMYVACERLGLQPPSSNLLTLTKQ